MTRHRIAFHAAATLLAVGPALAATHTIDVGGATLTFRPAALTIEVGDTVTWVNQGGVHNVLATSGASFRCANGCDGQGGDGDAAGNPWSFSRTFTSPGTIQYRCEPHGPLGMTGMIVVEDTGPAPEPGELRFSAANYPVQENVGMATVTLRRVNGSSGAVSVDWATGGGSASAGADYAPSSGTATWADGDMANKTFGVMVINDSAEESAETINLALSAPGGGAILGSPSNATITIAANDQTTAQPGTLAFSSAIYHGHEEVGLATIGVTRSGGSDGAVGVSWNAASGSATAGLDFTAGGGVLSWAAGESGEKTFDVVLLDDQVPENNETVQLALDAPTGGAGLGTPAAAELMVMDDDLDTSGPCVPGEQTLCLGADGRFRVEVDWRTAQGATGSGSAVPLDGRPDSGLFYFFNPNNVEMLIKVLNACTFNDRYWVFFAATTNVEFTVTVVDTEAGVPHIYTNPLNQSADAVTDTDAFATCP